MTLARRLESQMKEMESGAPVASSSLKPLPMITSSDSLDPSAQGTHADDENARERAIARAALSIAELCKCFSNLLEYGFLTSIISSIVTRGTSSRAPASP